jgi:radical SAM protein with 4Fe4S-binding SPASM domain
MKTETTLNYFRLFADVFFERGSQNSALYDIAATRIVPLDHVESEIIHQCEQNTPVSQVQGAVPGQVLSLLEKLQKNQLGRYYAAPVYVEKYRPALNINVEGLIEPPFIINAAYIQLTSECNLSCMKCSDNGLPTWQGCNTCQRWPEVEEEPYWTRESIDKLLGELLKYKIANVFVQGGNPLLSPELLLQVVTQLRTRKPPINTVVITNGSGANEQLLDRLAKLGVKIYLVMLGMNPQEYQQVTGAAHGFADFINAAIRCRDRQIPFAVTVVVGPHTSSSLAERKQMAEQLGASHVFFAERIAQTAENEVIALKVLATTGPRRVKAVNSHQLFLRKECNSCLNRIIALAADGTIRPCPMMAEIVGQLAIESLRDVFAKRRHETFWKFTKDAVADCHQCEYRYACVDCALVDWQVVSKPAMRRAVCSYDPSLGEWLAV